jgi:hypothetical protein
MPMLRTDTLGVVLSKMGSSVARFFLSLASSSCSLADTLPCKPREGGLRDGTAFRPEGSRRRRMWGS